MWVHSQYEGRRQLHRLGNDAGLGGTALMDESSSLGGDVGAGGGKRQGSIYGGWEGALAENGLQPLIHSEPPQILGTTW